MQTSKFRKIFSTLFLTMDSTDEESLGNSVNDSETSNIASSTSTCEIEGIVAASYLLKARRLSALRNIAAKVLTIDMLDDDWTWRNLRFRKNDLRTLLIELGVPDIFMLENGGKHSGEKAFILFLRRMAYPGRLTDLEHEFQKRKKNKGNDKDQQPVVKEIIDLDTSLSNYLDSKLSGAGDKKVQFNQKIELADRKLDLQRQIHTDKVIADDKNRDLRALDMEQRSKAMSDMMSPPASTSQSRNIVAL